jgi:hypothetical protein
LPLRLCPRKTPWPATVILLLVLAARGFALTGNGFPFLKLGVGARPVAMGSAYTALSDDANALFWNPAGIGFTRSYDASLMLQTMFDDISYTSLGLTGRVNRYLSAGLTGAYLSTSDTRRSAQGEELGSFPITDLAAGPGVAFTPLPQLAFGAAFKFIRSTLDTFSAMAVAGDFGALYSPFRYLYAGASLRNLGTPYRFIQDWAYPPVSLRAGLAGKLPLGQSQLTVAIDGAVDAELKPVLAVGAEGLLHLAANGTGSAYAGQALAIRAGYQTGASAGRSRGFSLGVGYLLPLTRGLFLSLDIVRLDYGYLGASDQASVSVRYRP